METSTEFRIASTADEFEQIHRLNYRTFVEEIPQHAPNAERRHVDKFHDENTYVVGIRAGRVIAQLALRRRRPFSVDTKLPDLDRFLPAGRNAVEIRLLAVEPAYRNGPVPAELLRHTAQYCITRGDDIAVISAAVRRLPLYRALGFEAFGPRVGTCEAPYQPMFLTLEKFLAVANDRRALRQREDLGHATVSPKVNLLPGPIAVSKAVLAAAAGSPTSHRAPEFLQQLTDVRRRLAALLRAQDVQVLPGSGSLANDVIAAQLAGLHRPGLVISTGEFGERLADHARRAGLEFEWKRLAWGAPLSPNVVEAACREARNARWLWVVHHETSTGTLHPIEELKSIARDNGMLLCLDCISSVGALRTSLDGVHLASGVSGKGLASVPGLALVFHATKPLPRQDLPRYLDLGTWAACESVPFTHSSNLVTALDVALAEIERLPAGRCELNDDAVWLREELRRSGFTLVAEEASASPVITTLELPPAIPAERLGMALEYHGYLTSYRSRYLKDRNWIQFCLMSAPKRENLVGLVDAVHACRDAIAARPDDRQHAPSPSATSRDRTVVHAA